MTSGEQYLRVLTGDTNNEIMGPNGPPLDTRVHVKYNVIFS